MTIFCQVHHWVDTDGPVCPVCHPCADHAFERCKIAYAREQVLSDWQASKREFETTLKAWQHRTHRRSWLERYWRDLAWTFLIAGAVYALAILWMVL